MVDSPHAPASIASWKSWSIASSCASVGCPPTASWPITCRPQRAVAHHEARVDGGPALQRVQVLAEGVPVPRRALLQRDQGHALHLGHHPPCVVRVLRPVGVERRQREAAVAARDGGHAVVHGGGGVRVPEQLGVVVRVRVDEAGREHQPGGVLTAPGLLPHAPGLPDNGDPPVPDPDIGHTRGRPGTVDEGRALDEVIKHAERYLLGRSYRTSAPDPGAERRSVARRPGVPGSRRKPRAEHRGTGEERGRHRRVSPAPCGGSASCGGPGRCRSAGSRAHR